MNTPLSELDFCVVDTETTGGSAAFNRIIDVAVYHYKDGIIWNTFKTLVNPGRPIPPWITLLTGIDDDMVRRAPTFSEVADGLHDILSKGIFVAHNAPFDFSFVQEEFRRVGREFAQPKLCTLRLARRLLPELPSRRLHTVCEHLLIDIWDRHRAHGDAEATVYVLKNLLAKAKREFKVETWEDLAAFLGPARRGRGGLMTKRKIQKESPLQLGQKAPVQGDFHHPTKNQRGRQQVNNIE